jgi:hypothetical protein
MYKLDPLYNVTAHVICTYTYRYTVYAYIYIHYFSLNLHVDTCIPYYNHVNDVKFQNLFPLAIIKNLAILGKITLLSRFLFKYNRFNLISICGC